MAQLQSLSIRGTDIIDIIYPVGSFYLSTLETSPATLFGGTWERISGRFLYGIEDTETAGTTGGERTHTLSVEEMPGHSHKPQGWAYQFQDGTGERVCLSESSEINNWSGQTSSVGGGQPHNNMPPYYGAYIWHRTA